MLKGRFTPRLLFFLILTDFLETFTQFCFKKGAISGQTGFGAHLLHSLSVFFIGVFSSPFLWLGLCSVAVTFVIWSTLLSKIDLSVAVPICSFSYILVPLVSIFALHEKIGALRWLGIIFILVGVVFVSLSSHEESGAEI